MSWTTRNLRWFPNGMGNEMFCFVNVPTIRSAFVGVVFETLLYVSLCAIPFFGVALIVPWIGIQGFWVMLLDCAAFLFLNLIFMRKRHSFVVTGTRIFSKVKAPVALSDVVGVDVRHRAIVVSTRSGHRHVYPFVCDVAGAKNAIVGEMT